MSVAPAEPDLTTLSKSEDLYEFANVLEGLPESLAETRRRVLRHLSAGVMVASHNLALASAGKSPFAEPTNIRAAKALMKIAPLVLEELPREDPKPKEYSGPPLIPKCPFCHDGPGAHWPADCQHNPDPDRWHTQGPVPYEWAEVFELRKTKPKPWKKSPGR
jgi:hypothetical protein